MRLTAELGQAWVTVGERDREGGAAPVNEGVATVAGQVEALESACVAVGRDPATLDRIVLSGLNLDSGLRSVDEFEDALGRYEAIGATDVVVHWPRRSEPYQGDQAAFEKLFQARL